MTKPREATGPTLFYDHDADLARLRGRRVAVIGFGSQGHAHAQNLADSGVEVVVGLRPGSPRWDLARSAGLEVATTADATRSASIVMVLVPDPDQRALYEREIEPHLRPGQTLMFAHGFSIRFGEIHVPEGVDVSLVAPKCPGHRLRELFVGDEGVPALVAVEADASGHALDDALAYAKAIGCTRAGVLLTTFAEEAETDLFGEQAVLCGGVTALVQAGFDTLVEAGYQPEVAYFECLHELKLIVDLMYRGGLGLMRYSVSDTAEYGDYVAGPRVVDERTRETMRTILAEVQSGQFSREWLAEHRAGRTRLLAERRRQSEHQIEVVGARLRQMMRFLSAGSSSRPVGAVA